MEDSTHYACSETKGNHLACCCTGSNSVLLPIRALYCHYSRLALSNMGDELLPHVYVEVCFFINYPVCSYCRLGAYA